MQPQRVKYGWDLIDLDYKVNYNDDGPYSQTYLKFTLRDNKLHDWESHN